MSTTVGPAWQFLGYGPTTLTTTGNSVRLYFGSEAPISGYPGPFTDLAIGASEAVVESIGIFASSDGSTPAVVTLTGAAGDTGNGYSGSALLRAIDSAGDAAPVTPSDSAALAEPANRLYVGGAGDVTLKTIAGNTVTFKAVPVGTTLDVGAIAVLATGTTATNIVALL